MTADETDPMAGHTARHPGFAVGLTAGLGGGALIGAALAVATLALLPAGALEGLRGEHPEPSVLATTVSTPSPTPLPSDAWIDVSSALPLEVTQPGTVIALGEPAVVHIAGADGALTLVEITAISVDAAPEKDQRTLRTAAPLLSGQTIYYARLSARWVAGDPLPSTSVGELFSLIDAQQNAISALLLRDWDACAPAATPASFAATSDSAEWCVAAASPTDGLIAVGVRFGQAGGPYGLEQTDATVKWLP